MAISEASDLGWVSAGFEWPNQDFFRRMEGCLPAFDLTDSPEMVTDGVGRKLPTQPAQAHTNELNEWA